MKTKSLWFATAAAVVLTGMTMMTSCSKDEPLLPEVIESEVYDEGEAGEVRAEVGTEGTQLSYESWIMVRGITRASFDNKVSVTLNNAFNNVDSVIEVGSFNLGECRTELVYEAANSRRQDFVTVTDSLLMYKVTFDVFSFSYDLYHEIGIYDDGITRQTMPYHPIRNVRDNGYTLTDLDFIIEDNGEGEQVVYLRKRFDHSISLDFNGKTYTLTAKIELRLYAGAHPAVVSSEIVNSGIGNIEHNLWTSRYTSWVEVKHRYSDGSIGNKTYTIENMRTEIDADIEKYKELPDADLRLAGAGFADAVVRDTVGMPERMVVCEVRRRYEVKYNYFTLSFPVSEYEAYYDDGLTRFEMPSLKYTDIREEHELRYVGKYEGDERDYLEYYFTQLIRGTFGDGEHEASESFQVIVYTE